MFEQRLTQNAKYLLGILNKIVPVGSYLAGGTALAMWINHRNSYDLDVYSTVEFDIEEMKQKFTKEIVDYFPISTSWQTVHGKSQDTEISLFYYQYDLLKDATEFLNFRIASVEDIAAMKLEAIAGRGLKRDFYDLYKIMVEKEWSLKKLIELNDRKYKREGSFTPHILRSLVYFNDAESMPERATEVDKEWHNVKQYFIREVSSLSDRDLMDL
ncbi:MAG: nucleotidyl transferase AbiEii/AbiGii toxin family protein [Paludibacteraceae bacterium]|nr:nucleotidyl transferase AbiEii/AbiGii toxin family protein [Paludibacteraceae bacterium]